MSASSDVNEHEPMVLPKPGLLNLSNKHRVGVTGKRRSP